MSEFESVRRSNIARNIQELISLGFLNPSGESMMTKGNKKRTREPTKPPVHLLEATRKSNRIEANSHCPSSPELMDDRFSVDECNRLTCNSCNIVFMVNSSNYKYSWRSHQRSCPKNKKIITPTTKLNRKVKIQSLNFPKTLKIIMGLTSMKIQVGSKTK